MAGISISIRVGFRETHLENIWQRETKMMESLVRYTYAGNNIRTCESKKMKAMRDMVKFNKTKKCVSKCV